MSLMKFCGFNGFEQFVGCKNKKVVRPTDFQIPELKDFITNVLFQFCWSFNLFAFGKLLIITGFNNGISNQIKKVELNEKIKQISFYDKICLILLENDQLFKYDILNDNLTEVIFRARINAAVKRSIFGESLSNDSIKLDAITHIGSCNSGFVAITTNGAVYCLPIKIFQFPSHMKVKYLCSGFEHFLVLNNNGDVYSWGNGSRGQLGHNFLDAIEYPQIIDALAGIKIIFISAGGWHSFALSAFGDIYGWGSNVNGQLGINVFKIVYLNPEKQIRKKNPTVFHLPEIIDIQCDCVSSSNAEDYNEINNCYPVKVKCGARHSVIQMNCGRIYGTGWNFHNQLGIQNENENNENFIDKFVQIKTINFLEVSDIICGHWCTIFKIKNEI